MGAYLQVTQANIYGPLVFSLLLFFDSGGSLYVVGQLRNVFTVGVDSCRVDVLLVRGDSSCRRGTVQDFLSGLSSHLFRACSDYYRRDAWSCRVGVLFGCYIGGYLQQGVLSGVSRVGTVIFGRGLRSVFASVVSVPFCYDGGSLSFLLLGFSTTVRFLFGRHGYYLNHFDARR